MTIPIKIKITEKPRRLENLFVGDTLSFPGDNRADEIVRVIDKEKGRLYTQRTRQNAKVSICYKVRYELEKAGKDYIFNDKCRGVIYDVTTSKK